MKVSGFMKRMSAKAIPCRSRAGFMDFGDSGDSYMEHWVNEYWDFKENRWVLADVDGYYEYEQRFGYSQFDLPRRKFVTASEAWLGLRRNRLQRNHRRNPDRGAYLGYRRNCVFRRKGWRLTGG